MNAGTEHRPPAGFTKFLKWFCKEEYYEDIQGDLEEEFYLQRQQSHEKANRWYRWQILKLFRPSMMKKLKAQQKLETQNIMFRNHLKIGIRNLLKHKSGTIINTLGLAVGIAAFLLIALFIRDELSYDKHHEFAEQVHRVTVKNFTPDGDLSRHWAFASAGHAERLKEDYAAITHAGRFFPWAFPDIEFQDLKLNAQQVVFADEDVFDIFSFPFIEGNRKEAFKDPYALVLTEGTAVRIFGENWRDKKILGQSVTLSRQGQSGPFKISGVIEDMPENQHFQFEYLAPMRFLEQVFGEDRMSNVGGNYNWLTYIRLKPETDLQLLETTTQDFFDKYIGDRQGQAASQLYAFVFQPLLDIHLHSNLEGEIQPNGSIQQVYVFSTVGILLLLVAAVNYMNLATSHFSRRMKEIGVRKVIGAGRTTLISQFLIESLLVTLLSVPLAIGLVHLGLPYVNSFMDKQLIFNWFESFDLILAIVALCLFIGILAGMYPALFLANIHVLKALKGESAVKSSRWNFRNWLVAFQYTVTISLIFVLLVINHQMDFIQHSDPGYQRSHMLNLSLTREVKNLKLLKRELLEHPDIVAATYSSRIPTGRLADAMNSSFYKGDSLVPNNFRLPGVTVDEDFIPTYNIELIAGSNFDEKMDMSKDSIGYYIINRKAAEAMGVLDPREIVGQKLSYGRYNGQQMRMGRIYGVVENFHFESLHSPIVPMVMLKASFNTRELSLEIKPGSVQNALAHIESVWRNHDSENPASYQFIDELFDRQYQQEDRLATMIRVFTILAVFIGCLGLIGMVGFIIETKVKEIGIRKVLGASIGNIMYLISNQFFILVLVAFIAAMPIAYSLMNGWLENFEFRVGISGMLIVLPLFITAILTVFILSYQIIKASLANPVDSLKDE